MAGVYIADAERPTTTEDCKFIEFAPFRTYCHIFNVCEGAKNCPLIAVPDHGRVIDIDAAIAKLEAKNRTERILLRFIKRCVIIGVCKALAKNAPTLLPPDRPTD